LVQDLVPQYFPANVGEYAARGTAIHIGCRYLVEGVWEPEGTHPLILPYIRGFELFLKDTGFKVLLIEQVVAHHDRQVAGTLDYYGVMKAGPVVLDVKSGSTVAPQHHLQVALYRALLESMGVKAKGTYIVQLKDDGGYTLVEGKDGPREAFAAMDFWHWKNKHRLNRSNT
jgi:hypothetical protein